jgi:hypothetical protein
MRSDSLIGYRLEIRITYSDVALKRVNGELFPSRQLKKKAYIPYPKGIGVLRHSYKIAVVSYFNVLTPVKLACINLRLQISLG